MYISIVAITLLAGAGILFFFSDHSNKRTQALAMYIAAAVASFSGVFLAMGVSSMQVKSGEIMATRAIVAAALTEVTDQIGDISNYENGEGAKIEKMKNRIPSLVLDVAIRPIYSEIALRNMNPTVIKNLILGGKLSQNQLTSLISSSVDNTNFNWELSKYLTEISFVKGVLEAQLKYIDGEITETGVIVQISTLLAKRREVVYSQQLPN